VLHVTLYLGVGELSPYQTFEREDGVLRVHYSLTLRWKTNEALAVLCEGDNRRSCPCTFCVFNDFCGLALHDGNTGVCCAEVNTDDGPCENVKTRKNLQTRMKRIEDAPDTLVFMLRAMAERGKPCASPISPWASARAELHVPRTGLFAVKRKQLSDEQQ